MRQRYAILSCKLALFLWKRVFSISRTYDDCPLSPESGPRVKGDDFVRFQVLDVRNQLRPCQLCRPKTISQKLCTLTMDPIEPDHSNNSGGARRPQQAHKKERINNEDILRSAPTRGATSRDNEKRGSIQLILCYKMGQKKL